MCKWSNTSICKVFLRFYPSKQHLKMYFLHYWSKSHVNALYGWQKSADITIVIGLYLYCESHGRGHKKVENNSTRKSWTISRVLKLFIWLPSLYNLRSEFLWHHMSSNFSKEFQCCLSISHLAYLKNAIFCNILYIWLLKQDLF